MKKLKKILSVLTVFIILFSQSAIGIGNFEGVKQYKNYGVADNTEITNISLFPATLYDYNAQEFNNAVRGKVLGNPVNFEADDINRTLFIFGQEYNTRPGNQNGHSGPYAAAQGIVENTLKNNNVVLTAGPNNNIKFFPNKSEVTNLIGNGKPYQEIIETHLPLISIGNGWYRYDSYSTHLKRINNSYKLYQGAIKGISNHGGLTPVAESNGGFFPFNSIDNININNEYFGMTLETEFYIYKNAEGKIVNSMTGEDVVFSFSGDDDIWIFVDDKLYLDIGGPHIAIGGEINFTEGTSTVEAVYGENGIINNKVTQVEKLEAGRHTMKIFYLERGGMGSNLYLNFNIEMIKDISGTKKWDDLDNTYQLRPESITINLLQDGKKIQEKVVTARDNWSYKFENLPIYNKNGKEHVYTITEDAVNQYETIIKGYNITNKLLMIDVSGEKIWDDLDNIYQLRPESITINLLQNNHEIAEKKVTAKDNWTYKFENLLEYDAQGNEYIYTITEDVIDKYETTINEYNVTNKLITNYDLELKKWVVSYTKIVDDKEQLIINNQFANINSQERGEESIVKIDLVEKDLNKTIVKIKYGIKVANLGDVPGYIREIVDFLPEGTEFYAEDNMDTEGKAFWRLEERKLIISEAYQAELDKELQPGEEKIFYVTLRLKVNEENFGLKNNKAKITKNESAWGIPDINLENDEDEVEVLVTIRTGEIIIRFAVIFTILSISLVGAFLIKRKLRRII